VLGRRRFRGSKRTDEVAEDKEQRHKELTIQLPRYLARMRKVSVRGISAEPMHSSKSKSSQAISEESFKKVRNSELPTLLTDLQSSRLEPQCDNRFRPSKIILTGVLISGEFKSQHQVDCV
jgi:hypothetical protein